MEQTFDIVKNIEKQEEFDRYFSQLAKVFPQIFDKFHYLMHFVSIKNHEFFIKKGYFEEFNPERDLNRNNI